MDLSIPVPRWLFRPEPPNRQTRTADESIHAVKGGVHVRQTDDTTTWMHYVGPADAEEVNPPKDGEA